MSTKSRKALTLKERVEVIHQYEKGGISTRRLAEDFGVGKTQILTTLKRKQEYLDDFEMNAPKKKRKEKHGDINKLCWDFFCECAAKSVPCSGHTLQEVALKFARELGVTEFKASNGWLDSFKKRHNIVGTSTVNRESGDYGEAVGSWKNKLSDITRRYAPRDIYNMTESGLYFTNSTKTLPVEDQECCDSEKIITLLLCFNMIGEKEKPLVIGKWARPFCFRNIDISSLPVFYYHNSKSRMTPSIFTDWLSNLDYKMAESGRKILLLLDSSLCHLAINVSNIELKFFPANVTSKLQPMEQEIIHTLKLKYRKRQLLRILQELEMNIGASVVDIAKKASILDAIYWIAASWKEINQETIYSCFRKAGFITDSAGKKNKIVA